MYLLFQHCQVNVVTTLWLKESECCHIALDFPALWGRRGKMYKMCSILGLLHWKWSVLDKDMKLIPTRLLWSKTTKEKNAVKQVKCDETSDAVKQSRRGPTFPLLKRYLKHSISHLCHFSYGNLKREYRQLKGKKCVRASQPCLIILFPFCPFSCVHVLSPERFWVI